jgi:hypothetical protein
MESVNVQMTKYNIKTSQFVDMNSEDEEDPFLNIKACILETRKQSQRLNNHIISTKRHTSPNTFSECEKEGVNST